MPVNIPRRYWRNLDWPLILAVLCLIAIGMVVIYSASYSQLVAAGLSPFYYVRRQALAFLLGLVLSVVAVWIDYRDWKRWSRLVYAATTLLLVGVLFFGNRVFGSQRWVRLGSLSIQPSELAKLALILMLAKVFENEENAQDVKGVVQAALLTLVPMGLIMLQPDLGTAGHCRHLCRPVLCHVVRG